MAPAAHYAASLEFALWLSEPSHDEIKTRIGLAYVTDNLHNGGKRLEEISDVLEDTTVPKLSEESLIGTTTRPNSMKELEDIFSTDGLAKIDEDTRLDSLSILPELNSKNVEPNDQNILLSDAYLELLLKPDKLNTKVSIALSRLKNRVPIDVSSFNQKEIEVMAIECNSCRNWWCERSASKNPPIGMTFFIVPSENNQIGLSVKDINGQVLVSGFDFNIGPNPPGKRAGLRIGDRIIVVNGSIITDIGSLQAAIKQNLTSESGSENIVNVLIIRYNDMIGKGISKDLCDDPHSKKIGQEQSKFIYNYYLSIPDTSVSMRDDDPVDFCEIAKLSSYKYLDKCPSFLLGGLISILFQTNHPLLTDFAWRSKTCKTFLKTIAKQVFIDHVFFQTSCFVY